MKLRRGLTRSDGQPFSADDVVFTDQMIRNTSALAYSAAYSDQIASITKVDDNNVEITTTRPTPRLSVVLGSVIYGNSFHVVPKHIWEKQDPATFQNFPPVSISAYKYKDHDPNGTWFLWEKRKTGRTPMSGRSSASPRRNMCCSAVSAQKSAECWPWPPTISTSSPTFRRKARISCAGKTIRCALVYRLPLCQFG
ncbi:ABC transporter substrate-binding protein (plasmid) [Devosia sp. A8/3-2]|nr:ABC transporter substrate-binding protein [Devosia sp. A8/3-2]